MKNRKHIEGGLSSWVIHLIKYRDDNQQNQDPFSILKKILKESNLIGSKKLIRGGFPCICFTETPLVNLLSLIRYSNDLSLYTQVRPVKYSPFGIAVKKK